MTKTRSTVYLYTSFSSPSRYYYPTILHPPSFQSVRSTGQTDVFTSYDGLILNLSHFSWLNGSWIQMQQFTCENWEEEGTHATRLWKQFCPFEIKKFKNDGKDSIWVADISRKARYHSLLLEHMMPNANHFEVWRQNRTHVGSHRHYRSPIFNIKIREKNGFTRNFRELTIGRVMRYDDWDNHKVGWGLKKWKLVARRTTQNISTDFQTSQIKKFLTGYSQHNQSNDNRVPLVTFRTTRKCKLVGKNVSKMCRVGIEPSRSQRSNS